jgi:putative transposase
VARPLRIQYPNALYHVMNRGVSRKCIYQNETQRLLFLSLLEEMTIRYRVEIHAYCLMSNHYHLLIKTPFANLDRAMRHLRRIVKIKAESD